MKPNWLDFLRDDSPYSTMRVSVVIMITLFLPVFIGVWLAVSVESNELAPIPDSVQWLLGILLGAKVAQKTVETIGNIFLERKNKNGDTG